MTIDASLLLRAAEAAAGTQQYPKGTLYLVATPIGNLADMSLRAIHLLALADSVACEDTRHSGALLRHLGLTKPLLPLPQPSMLQLLLTLLLQPLKQLLPLLQLKPL